MALRRVHLTLDEGVLQEIDAEVGPRERSRFILGAILEELDHRRRSRALEDAIGVIPDDGHEWDDDPAEWVRQQRRADPRRGG